MRCKGVANQICRFHGYMWAFDITLDKRCILLKTYQKVMQTIHFKWNVHDACMHETHQNIYSHVSTQSVFIRAHFIRSAKEICPQNDFSTKMTNKLLAKMLFS